MINNIIQKTIDVLSSLTTKLSNIKSKINTNTLLSTQFYQLNDKIDYLSGLLITNTEPEQQNIENQIIGYILSGCEDNDYNGTFNIDNSITQDNKPVYKHFSEQATSVMGYDIYIYLFYSNITSAWYLGWDNYNQINHTSYINYNNDPSLGSWEMTDIAEFNPPTSTTPIYN